MKIFDISQEVFGCEVYSGDRAPERIADKRMSRGDLYNLTSFIMCAHNGTHIDAPFHFFENGCTVESIPLENTVGECFVTEQNADIDGSRAEKILASAEKHSSECARRILIKGQGIVLESAARLFADSGVLLLGVEGQSVGPENEPMAVHKALLSSEVTLLEGLRLAEIKEGKYFLCAVPISLGGSDGAPCRAILIEP